MNSKAISLHARGSCFRLSVLPTGDIRPNIGGGRQLRIAWRRLEFACDRDDSRDVSPPWVCICVYACALICVCIFVRLLQFLRESS